MVTKRKRYPIWFLRDARGNDQYFYTTNLLVQTLTDRWGETLDLWGKVGYTEWEPVRTFQPTKCGCGRDYKLKNGAIFLGLIPAFDYALTLEELKDLLRKPILCQICFYQKEILAGNWAPKAVYDALGLQIPN